MLLNEKFTYSRKVSIYPGLFATFVKSLTFQALKVCFFSSNFLTFQDFPDLKEPWFMLLLKFLEHVQITEMRYICKIV